ncbi:hypothetical protein [Alkalitalea saponilacus]|uniref:Uncharacterized protein n=1 Tax=Alkalitalea saponilacus TaxID=889453 RepID=A0A1T5HUF4_9BACT|nr:hypothetical protein [Alkalitalea saponilacus]ASB50739.1 hypothetical protein CDL62_17070 [Alkalitalea saponilacus]SKC24312.1 hypothetical protein SAMN03080601_03613 [Alkalitalea saponilacus]
MDANKKLQRYLPILGFSLLMVVVNISCKYNVIAEYSFHNKLESDVELLLYMSGDPFKGKVYSQYIIPSGEYVKFIMLQTDKRDGFGQEYFCHQLDSAKLRINGDNEFIATWRNGEEAEYTSGYEMKWNFFCEWWEKIQHGGSHAEYRYWLQLIDEN